MAQRTRLTVAVAAVAAVMLAALSLSACASGGGASTPTPAPTVTVTVTETPAPVAQSPDDPLTPLTAWAICYGAAVTNPNLDPADWEAMPYSADAVTAESDGSFTILIGFAPKNADASGAGIDCTVSGTLGAPVLTTNGPYDFG